MKKLMGLLFEEEEVIEEEIFEDEPISHPLPLRKEEKRSAPKQQTHTADVHKPLLKNAISAEETNTVKELKRSTNVELEPISEPKPEPKRISMDIDDLTGAKAHPTKTVATKPIKKEIKGGYEFSPVISPIFGVDEKDTDAVIPTKSKKKVSDSRIGTIISPMYGVDKDAEPELVEVHSMPSLKKEKIVHDQEIVNLTLDDILARTAAISGKTKEKEIFDTEDDSLFSEKKVINSRNISLFDEED